MNRNDSMKKLAMVVGATFSAAAAMPAAAEADGADAFALQDFGTSGYALMAKADAEGKCGGADSKASAEGKCGGAESKSSAEGKCGEGKCGGAESKASGEGKCGGADSKASAEGKCGEGKCGGA